MRDIHLDEGLRLRFPKRNEEFNQGVEIGMVAVLGSIGAPSEGSPRLAEVAPTGLLIVWNTPSIGRRPLRSAKA